MDVETPSREFIAGYFESVIWPMLIKTESVQVEILDAHAPTCPKPASIGWSGDHWHILAARNHKVYGEARQARSFFAALCHEAAHVLHGHHGRLPDGTPPPWSDLNEDRMQALGLVKGPAAVRWLDKQTVPPSDKLKLLEEEATTTMFHMVVDYWPVLLESWRQGFSRPGYHEAVVTPVLERYLETKEFEQQERAELEQ